ncbi:MAG: hypothetical protein KKE37_00380 [Verrucomicrobia bacterium]|nr:hypothetical protein [Verrucomicrobiota bacterium]MBU4246975.1 hypothetical protein [Verrucomicrobiota bacterium]MBU4290511.1 hypothetical protein [Verrucomicrobiota bacterium]MBU4427792.1 hypothetical protein [Verrucomicrobiota bacterium]MCG2681292.1 hypothetical protein [Kiritimatiellia bacterium]
MSIEFSPDRWNKIKADARAWWAGELDRPLIQVTLSGRDPGRPEPPIPSYGFSAFYDDAVPAEAIIDRWDYNLSSLRFLGDAFPSIWSNFGAGVIAAFMGANLKKAIPAGTVWFHPKRAQEIENIHFQFEPDNRWFKRIQNIYRAGLDHWQGQVQMGMTDLGGNLDILSSFRPSEKLLLDLYDHPAEVKRLTGEAHECWWQYFDTFNALLHPVNPGYTAWTPLFSEIPYYILQCDFCYMISPAMFDEFVKPELQASCRRLGNAFYHLDGPGQLPHLDSLLSIPELKGVQWIPGAGQPDMAHWPEVYRKIRQAGKLIQISGTFETLDSLATQLGSAKGICLLAGCNLAQEKEVLAGLRRYGAI